VGKHRKKSRVLILPEAENRGKFDGEMELFYNAGVQERILGIVSGPEEN
jgi:hypothetical protein